MQHTHPLIRVNRKNGCNLATGVHNGDMKKPYKFTLPEQTINEIKARAASYSLSVSGLVEVIIEHLRERSDANEMVLKQKDDTHHTSGICFAMNDADFDLVRKICAETGVRKRIVIMAALRLFTESFHAPSAQTADKR